MDLGALTAYGAELASPARAAALLRARASAAGLALRAAPAKDLIAGVVGGHAWSLAVGSTSLSAAPGPDAAAALAGVLARAAGHGAPTMAARPVRGTAAGLDPVAVAVEDLAEQILAFDVAALPQEVLARLEDVTTWLEQVGGGPAEVAVAAADLAPGWGDPRVAAISDALLTSVSTRLEVAG